MLAQNIKRLRWHAKAGTWKHVSDNPSCVPLGAKHKEEEPTRDKTSRVDDIDPARVN